ncbi:MAG: hypothetical protein VKL39_24270, partial [Leptolyngbyaceae bacterium]|nr:hypothetical protein [Leptolyngbyaceae bacterium]
MMSSNTTTSPLPLGEGASLVRTKGEHLAERVRAFACRPTIALTRNRCALSTSPDGRGGFSLVE